jgi:hypothetical protein
MIDTLRIAFLATLCVLVGCGDNQQDADAVVCRPQAPPLPMGADPYEIELPPSCVEEGLGGLPGRWFVTDIYYDHVYGYPRFGGDCDTSFNFQYNAPCDDDPSDGFTCATWSDGTRFVYRAEISTSNGETSDVYEFVACVLPDDTLAIAEGYLGSIYQLVGKRFFLRERTNLGLRLVGSNGLADGGATDIERVGALVAMLGTGVEFVDVSQPSRPTAVGYYPTYYSDIDLIIDDGRTFLVGAEFNQVELIEITSPSTPVLVAQIPIAFAALHVVVENGTPYLYAAGPGTIHKFDMSDPVAPVSVGEFQTATFVNRIFVDSPMIYTSSIGMLNAYDASAGLDAATLWASFPVGNPDEIWSGTIGGREVVLLGEGGGTGTEVGMAFLRVLEGDSSSSRYLQELSRYQSRPEVGIGGFQVVGNLVYLAYRQDGVRVLDLSDPLTPNEIAHFNTFDIDDDAPDTMAGAAEVRVDGDMTYVADFDHGLVILRRD